MKNKLRIIFMGTPEFSVPSLKEISSHCEIISVYTQPPRSSGRGLKTKLSPIHILANKMNFLVKTPNDFSDLNVVNEIVKLNVDFIIVVAYGLLLPPSILKSPKFLCLNGHASDLPRWRGAAPIQRAIEAGDKSTAVCAMIMEETLDTGPIISKKNIPISNSENSQTLHEKMSEEMSLILMEAIELVSSKKYVPKIQSKQGVTYAKKITSTETIINWSNQNILIERKLRAFSTWPGCWTYHRKNRIRIHKASIYDINIKNIDFSHGQVVDFSINGCPVIFTGHDTFLEILELQKDGRKKMGSEEFLRGYKLEVGDIFNNHFDN